MSKKIIEKYFSDSDLKEISNSINNVESETSGELRLCVHIKKSFFDRKKSPREIALKTFLKMGMHKTKHRTGVLIYLLLDERKFEIIADEGINKLIADNEWTQIEQALISEYRESNYLKGVQSSIKLIGEKLKIHFPREENDINELSNDVLVK